LSSGLESARPSAVTAGAAAEPMSEDEKGKLISISTLGRSLVIAAMCSRSVVVS
jgi:hypothetical protein